MPTQPAILTLTTDFGSDSAYVAQMKGVILGINRRAALVDITHAVPPQDIHYGAVVLDDVTRYFPPGTVHVAVVDPGVGTERRIVYVCMRRQHFFAPDNGLLSLAGQRTRPERIIKLTTPHYWLPNVSHTFHGRDVMAPAAAHLSLGLDARQLGQPAEGLVELDWPEVQIEPDRIRGSVLTIDTFGNLITDITTDILATGPRPLAVRCCGHETHDIVRTYGDRSTSSLVALIGSSGRLELAIVDGNAACRLNVQRGAAVEVLRSDQASPLG